MKPDPLHAVAALLPPVPCPRRLAVSLVTLHMLWFSVAWSQRSWTLFGPCADRGLGFAPRSLAISPAAAQLPAEIAVADAEHPRIVFFEVGAGGALLERDTCALPHSAQSLAAADLDGDGIQDYVALQGSASTVTIVRRNRHGTHEPRTVPAPPAQRLVVADIDNDRRPDILLFGRTAAGVATLLGTRSGDFVPGPQLFPDISVSDLAVTDLNGDGISDVFLLNWLSNQLVVFYGIARTVFSEQLTVDTPGEPAELCVSPVTSRHTVRVAVTIPAERHVVLFDGNSLGDFTQTATIDCPAPPAGIVLADVNGDRHADLVASSARGMVVFPASGPGTFAPPQLFGSSTAGTAWGVAAVDGDAMPDLVTADQTTRRLSVVANANGTGTLASARRYSVGAGPAAVAVADVNGDGLRDLSVANRISGTVSILLNEGHGNFRGQISVPVHDQPGQISSFQTGSRSGLVVAHPSTDRLTVITVNGDPAFAQPYSMPTGDRPVLVGAKTHAGTERLEIMVSNRRTRDVGVSLSSFEQLSGRQFLERTIHFNVPGTVLAATAGRLPGQDASTLVFAAGDRGTRRSTIYSATPTAVLRFDQVSPVFSYPDSSQDTRSLVLGTLHADSSRDALVLLDEPANAAGVFRFTPGRPSSVRQWLKDFSPADDASVVLQDADGDGTDDILLLQAGRRQLQLYRGTPAGRYSGPETILDENDLGAFAVGPLGRSGESDLIVTRPHAGCVSILDHPFRKATQ